MSVSSVARWFGLALGVVVLVASGTYLLVYLYRWEWNRAQISGTFFLGALVVLASALILSRLRRLERRLERVAQDQDAAPPWYVGPTDDRFGTAGVVRQANDDHARRHFDWLEESTDRLGVFVPFLIGAGVILSVLAYVIERIAGLIAGPTVDRRIAESLAPHLPLGPGRQLDDAVASLGPQPRRPRAGRTALGLVVLAGLITGFVLIAREATQNRAEPALASATTTVDLDISQRGAPEPAEEVAEALSIACRMQLPRGASFEVLDDEAEQVEAEFVEATLVVDRGMGPQRRRRFFGCLEDATLDRVDAKVTRFEVSEPTT